MMVFRLFLYFSLPAAAVVTVPFLLDGYVAKPVLKGAAFLAAFLAAYPLMQFASDIWGTNAGRPEVTFTRYAGACLVISWFMAMTESF